MQYAIEPHRGGFLVTDGHLNRVLRVTLDGEISELRAFGNVVPTGLELHGNTVYRPARSRITPRTVKVVAFGPSSPEVTEVASGASLLVDVKLGRGQTLYALSQGFWEGEEGEDGTPANPLTGSLVRVNASGGFNVLVTGLNIPTSFQLIGDTAYVVTLLGEIWPVRPYRWCGST